MNHSPACPWPEGDGEQPKNVLAIICLLWCCSQRCWKQIEGFGQPSQGLKRLLGSQQGLHNGRKQLLKLPLDTQGLGGKIYLLVYAVS